MNYLIVGTGGVGGNIAAFLSMAGKEVTCIARGAHLNAIRENGLKLASDLMGNRTIRIEAYTAEEYTGKADVIFVCVKGYSIDSIAQLIDRAAHENTIVIPILNVYGTGPKLQRLLPNVTVLDGCVYIVGHISAPGQVVQTSKIFRIIFGAHKGTTVAAQLLETVQRDLQESGIKAEISTDINRDTFVKWSFISAMACTGAYYNAPIGEGQKPGAFRDTFTGLSGESAALGKKMGIIFDEDPIAYNLKVLDKMTPESTASMQKDLARGGESEIQGLLFDLIATARKYHLETPIYDMVAKKFERKTEKEKMFDGEPFNAHTPEMLAMRARTKRLLHQLNVSEYYTDKFRDVTHELCPNSAEDLHLEPPFYCDYGQYIYAGKNVFVNAGVVILDGAKVTIGANTLIAPGVHIYTAEHPLDAAERAKWENCRPVTIGESCWIGGHATICPGVTIGNRAVVGAGSVVTKDIPDDSLAVGNPARVIRKLNDRRTPPDAN